MAIEYIHSPLGKNVDVFVTSDGKIYKYDYSTNILAIAYMNNMGTIGTFWNLSVDYGSQGADIYWEKHKTNSRGINWHDTVMLMKMA